MIENVALMIAWLPATKERMKSISTGHLILSVLINELEYDICPTLYTADFNQIYTHIIMV